jgi:hypothetical protein
MEKDEPREMELEQELESLYHKVASLAPVEDKQEQDKELKGQTTAPADRKKRKSVSFDFPVLFQHWVYSLF